MRGQRYNIQIIVERLNNLDPDRFYTAVEISEILGIAVAYRNAILRNFFCIIHRKYQLDPQAHITYMRVNMALINHRKIT